MYWINQSIFAANSIIAEKIKLHHNRFGHLAYSILCQLHINKKIQSLFFIKTTLEEICKDYNMNH